MCCILLSMQVVGPIPIPCSYESDSFSFTTEDCKYSDADGWNQYAQQYIQVSVTAWSLRQRSHMIRA